MSEKEDLKQKIFWQIDKNAQKLIELGKMIWNHPEPGYYEFKTAARIKEIFDSIALPTQAGLARTGIRADLSMKRPGPHIAILGELDALIMPEHPQADPVYKSAHACGHNMQLTALAGAALGLGGVPEVREKLSGLIAFIACPAEECKIDFPDESIKYLGGKAELIRRGVFDDIQISFMTHAGGSYGAAQCSNGFVMKEVIFLGKAAHAGRPSSGVNALSAARTALNALDSQRDTFQDQDCVRIHGIIKNGGYVVNIVPEKVELEYQIRAMTPDAIRDANKKFDRSMKGAAMAFGVDVQIKTYAGYMPLYNEPELLKIHKNNLFTQRPGTEFIDFGKRTSSTDMGDVSAIMPAIHPYAGGWEGVGHTPDYHWKDDRETFVEPAKVLAANAVDLLYGDAETAQKIAKIKPRFTKTEYLAFLDTFNREEYFSSSGKE
ncbi:MAG: amidohydrolase [Lentisphaeria bacterium]|nr:amidohydrolase [Lentisphaeria bacterium]